MKTVLIGTGMVAATHARAVAEAAGVSLHGVFARDMSKARAFAAAEAEGARIYRSVGEVADDREIDFAIVLTPPDARLGIAQTLAGAGKPILMEKPVERSLTGARAVVEACANLPLGIVFQHRFRDVCETLHKMLGQGALGNVHAVEIAVPWWREQSYYDAPGRGTYGRDGGGVLISQAIHTLDLVLSLLGPVRRVQAMARTKQSHQMEAEDFVSAGLEFASGAVGSLIASTASFPGGAESITVHGAQGSACLASGQLVVNWRDGHSETLGTVGATGGGADPMAFTHGWHQKVIEDFADALRAGRPPRVTGAEALRVHALIEAISRASQTGKMTQVDDV